VTYENQKNKLQTGCGLARYPQEYFALFSFSAADAYKSFLRALLTVYCFTMHMNTVVVDENMHLHWARAFIFSA
jgi:hypothetical protein